MPYTAPATAQAHAALAEVNRLRLLEILRAHSDTGLDAATAAAAVGLHVATTRVHLETLVAASLAVRSPQPRSTRGRPAIIYRAVRAEDATGDPYRLLAELLASMIESQNPSPRAIAERAGKEWGRSLVRRARPLAALPRAEALKRLQELLDDLGFEPESTADGNEIQLHRCPFLDVAADHRSVVCSAHLGIIKGALEGVGMPMGRTTLKPLVTPTLCVAHLAK